MERNAEDEKKYINLSNVENLPHCLKKLRQ